MDVEHTLGLEFGPKSEEVAPRDQVHFAKPSTFHAAAASIWLREVVHARPTARPVLALRGGVQVLRCPAVACLVFARSSKATFDGRQLPRRPHEAVIGRHNVALVVLMDVGVGTDQHVLVECGPGDHLVTSIPTELRVRPTQGLGVQSLRFIKAAAHVDGQNVVLHSRPIGCQADRLGETVRDLDGSDLMLLLGHACDDEWWRGPPRVLIAHHARSRRLCSRIGFEAAGVQADLASRSERSTELVVADLEVVAATTAVGLRKPRDRHPSLLVDRD